MRFAPSADTGRWERRGVQMSVARRWATAFLPALVLATLLVGIGAPRYASAAPAAPPATPTTLRRGAIPAIREGSATGLAAHATTSAIAGNLSYGGGSSLGIGVTTGAPRVYLVYWGSQWGPSSTNAQGYLALSNDPSGMVPYLQAFMKGLGTGSDTWSGIVTQYCDGVATGAQSCPADSVHVPYPTGGALAGVWADTAAAAPNAATGHQLATEAVAAADHFGNTTQASNRDAQYFIVSPFRTSPDEFTYDGPTLGAGICGWHDSTGDAELDGGGAAPAPFTAAFSNLGYIPQAGTYCGMNLVNQGAAGTLDGVSLVASGLYAATLTDQFSSTLTDQFGSGGWTSSPDNEVDSCDWTTSGPGAAQDITLPTGVFPVQSLWANDDNGGAGGCEISHPIVTNGADLVRDADPGDQANPIGTALDLQIAASGPGGAPLTYGATALPAGLSIAADSGLISGTPTTYATSLVTVTATDAAGSSDNVSFNWAVYPATAPVITSPNHAVFEVGEVPSTFTVTTNASPVPQITVSGSLPNGFWLMDNHDGTATLEGVAPQGSGGVYPFVVSASYHGNNATNQDFTVTVTEAPAITSTNGATFPIGIARSVTVTTVGFPAPALTETGPLPLGVTFDTTIEALGGTPGPGTSGSYPVTFTAATNGVGPAVSQSFALTVNQATITYPTSGQRNVDTTRPFTWSTIPEATAYQLTVGTTPGGSDVFNSKLLPVSQSSVNMPALPAGPTLYATLSAPVTGGGATTQTVSFTAAPGLAAFTFPLNGQSSIDSTKPFTWTTIPQAQSYILVVGTKQYGSNLVNSGALPATQSSYATPVLPTGITLYATLLTEVNGAYTRFQAIDLSAEPGMGRFTFPLGGFMFGDPPTKFTWSTIAGAQNYWLVVGTTPFGSNVLNSGLLPPAQSSYTKVPPLTEGQNYFCTLLTKVDGTWVYQSIVVST